MTDTTDKLSLQQLKDVRELCLPHTAWRLIIDELISARDRLEAERQQAERAKSALDSMTRQRDEVERLRVVLCHDKENLIDKCIERDKEIAALKGELANPVVLPERWKPCDCID